METPGLNARSARFGRVGDFEDGLGTFGRNKRRVRLLLVPTIGVRSPTIAIEMEHLGFNALARFGLASLHFEGNGADEDSVGRIAPGALAIGDGPKVWQREKPL